MSPMMDVVAHPQTANAKSRASVTSLILGDFRNAIERMRFRKEVVADGKAWKPIKGTAVHLFGFRKLI
jgi:hypothetical protein